MMAVITFKKSCICVNFDVHEIFLSYFVFKVISVDCSVDCQPVFFELVLNK